MAKSNPTKPLRTRNSKVSKTKPSKPTKKVQSGSLPKIKQEPKFKKIQKAKKVYRSAEVGRFVTKKYAEAHPKTTVKETIKKGGGTDHTGPRRK
jgi:hypothetical protein